MIVDETAREDPGEAFGPFRKYGPENRPPSLLVRLITEVIISITKASPEEAQQRTEERGLEVVSS